MRHSDQRDIVYQVVCQSCDHPSVEMILSRAKEQMPSINMATVYRNLSVLVDQNKIIRLALTTGDRFDKTLYPHPHFYCKCCGNVTDVDHDAVSDMITSIESQDFQIDKTDIMFTGICPKCKN